MSTFSKKNETSVVTTSIGSAIAVILIWTASQFFTISGVDASLLVGAFTVIFNFLIPKRA